jgi:hypothetical protein
MQVIINLPYKVVSNFSTLFLISVLDFYSDFETFLIYMNNYCQIMNDHELWIKILIIPFLYFYAYKFF